MANTALRLFRVIFTDIPNSREEADRMISLGILPTHTIVLDDRDETICMYSMIEKYFIGQWVF